MNTHPMRTRSKSMELHIETDCNDDEEEEDPFHYIRYSPHQLLSPRIQERINYYNHASPYTWEWYQQQENDLLDELMELTNLQIQESHYLDHIHNLRMWKDKLYLLNTHTGHRLIQKNQPLRQLLITRYLCIYQTFPQYRSLFRNFYYLFR